MRKILGLCLSAVAVVATMAPANAGWQKIAQDETTGDVFHLDTNVTVPGYGTVHYWYKETLRYPDQYGTKSLRYKIEGKCFSNTTRMLEIVAYDSRGRKIEHHVSDGWNSRVDGYARSGSFGDYVLQLACSVR